MTSNKKEEKQVNSSNKKYTIDLKRFDKKLILKNRIYIFSAVAILGLFLFMFLVSSSSKTKHSNTSLEIKTKKRGEFLHTGAEMISDENMWRTTIEDKIDDKHTAAEKEIQDLKNMLIKQQADFNTKLEQMQQETQQDAQKRELYFKNKLDYLTAQSLKPEESALQVQQVQFDSEKIADKKTKNPENYVPLGSFVKAVLMHGSDASTALTASSDPEPVTLEILDNGKLPGNFKSHLKQCRIIGGSYGHLSSERLKIRLEQLSCIDKRTGEAVESRVKGYVVGGDSKVGTRGQVVSRNGGLLGMGIISGFINNIASAAKSTAQTPFILTGPAAPPANAFEENVKEGALKSGADAADRISNYYISRAEQIQPVIDVDGGRLVTVFFSKGFYLTEEKEEKETESPNKLKGLYE